MARTIVTLFKNNMKYTTLLCSILFTANVSAQNEGRWYDVEVLIFKRLGSEAFTQESWPTNIELSYPNSTKYIQDSGSGNLSALPVDSRQLGGFNYTLRKDEDYRVLTHKSWRQQMDSERKSPAIIISGGEALGGHKELEGTIKIYIARYLHVITDLWLTQTNITADASINTTQEWPAIPARPGSSAIQNDFGLSSYPVATLKERRRMRSKELHYIDHPLMGVLILFTPINE